MYPISITMFLCELEENNYEMVHWVINTIMHKKEYNVI